MSAIDKNDPSSRIQENSLYSMTQEKMVKFIYGGYQVSKVGKEKSEKLAREQAEEEDRAAVYSEFVKLFDQPPEEASTASVFVRGGVLNEKGVSERTVSEKQEHYVFGGDLGDKEEKEAEEENCRKPEPAVQPPPPSANGFKFTYTKFVPVTTSTTQKKEKDKSSKTTDLMSFFGDHSDDDAEDSKKKQDMTFRVNRKTNIHYAIHRTGEKSQLDRIYEESLREKERTSKQMSFVMQDQSRFTQRLHSLVPSHNLPSSDPSQEHLDPSPSSTPANGSSTNPYETPTNTNLYFGNLPPTMTDLRLYKLCAYYGRVASVTVKKPRGEEEHAYAIGFVNMLSHEEAELVIQKLNKSNVEGNLIRVDWAKGGNRVNLLQVPPGITPIYISFPSSPKQLRLIRSVAVLVHNRGSAFEYYLIQYIVSHPDLLPAFNFLTQTLSPANVFYRWCLLLLGNEESFASYSPTPFQFTAGGPFFIPPPAYEEKRQEQQKRLDREEADRRRKRELEIKEEEESAKRRKEQG